MAGPSDRDLDDEAPLVARIQAGERAAFAEVVKRHRGAVLRLVRGWVASDAEAEDLTQQTFLSALRAIETFRGEARLATWLHRIALNTAKNHARDEKRTRSVSIEEVELITNALGTGRMAAREAKRKLAAALADLPAKQRLVVELRLVHELSFKAIAEIAACSEESARANFQHGTKRLREAILGEPSEGT